MNVLKVSIMTPYNFVTRHRAASSGRTYGLGGHFARDCAGVLLGKFAVFLQSAASTSVAAPFHPARPNGKIVP